MTDLQRFLFLLIDRIDDNGCFIVRSPNHEFGYRMVSWGGRSRSAHCLAFVSEYGDPGSLQVLHKCSIPQCINPEHLYAGTQWQNMQDRKARGLYHSQIGEKNYCAKLTESDVTEIRHPCGFLTQDEIAAIYGISRPNVEAIHVRRSWKHVVNMEAR